MGVQFDLIIPPVIVGFIILALFSINNAMTESSINNRLSHEMQSFADNTVILLQHEIRTLDSLDTVTDSTIRFINTNREAVEIYRRDRNLVIERTPRNATASSVDEYPARLKRLSFEPQQMVGSIPSLLRFRAVTESTPDQQMRGESGQTSRAYAEKQVYLRNIFYE